MKTRIFYINVLLLFLALSNALGQTYKQKLKPGEMVSDISFTILKNGKFETAMLSSFRGKLVILDYWNIWCSSCIAAFPNLEKIQEKFRNDILILPVSFINTKSQVSDFVKKRKGTDNEVHLPFAIFESKNNMLFQSIPTIGYPFEVWIDKDGRFIRASNASDITTENIAVTLSGGKLALKSKNYQMDFDAKKPLLINNNGGPDTAYAYRSVITGFIDSIGQVFDNSVSNTKRHLYYGNKPLIDLIKYSLKNGLSNDFYNQHIIFEGSALKDFFFPGHAIMANRNWRKTNSYCYDLTVPASYSKEEAYKFMHQDIDRYFKITTALEDRNMNCLVLNRVDSIDRLASKSDKSLLKGTKKLIEIKKRNIIALLSLLNSDEAPILLNETNYSKDVDITLNLPERFNVDFLNKQLINYGLKLEAVERKLPVIVIKQ
jgi:thiol-disulfide isomerase/thioredoxin